MTKRIEIPKNILKKLYLDKKMSTYKISKKLKCDPTVIQKRIRECHIKLRKPKEKIKIPKEKLYDLYINKKLSTQTIAKLLGFSSSLVYYKLKESGIPVRYKNIIKISKEKLKKLYLKKNLSCSEIARIFNCDKVTIFNKLKRYKLNTKSLSEVNVIFPKKKFFGDNELKAYMIGFRLGDLNVKSINKNSTVYIKSNTTKKEQVDLIRQIYGKYGHFKVSQRKKDYCVWCNLDKSFSFLSPKEDKIEEWILNDNNCFFSFLAGYSDAEGSFGIYQHKARFRIGSYDKNILNQIKYKLNYSGISAKSNLEGKANPGKYNKDFYRVSVNKKNCLLDLINLIKPYTRHKKRLRDMIKAEKNILERNKKCGVRCNVMKTKKKFYVTTPIYYANAAPAVGSAYTTIAADILARWHRLKGENVFFLTGTDEHGQKIQEASEKAGLKSQEFVNKISSKFEQTFKLLNISNNYFIRTTNEDHVKEVQKILQELYDKEFIYKGECTTYYCVGCEQYITKSDLIEGKCPLHNKEPEIIKEEAYMFRLSKFQDEILRLIKEGKYNILPRERRNEVVSFIESGLKDISISRKKEKVYWGIELPFDKSHTCYVWVDAFWNYITGLKINGVYKEFWPADVQLMANDISRVHATIWPALLLALKQKLPRTLFIHGFFTVNGQKMSKSLGNAIDPVYISKKYGTDSLRYFLIRNIPFGQDGDFSEEILIERHNNELANKLGNLVSRVAGLCKGQFSKGKIDEKLSNKLNLKEIEKHFDNFETDKAINEIFSYIDKCNEYVAEKQPWTLNGKEKENILYALVDSIRVISIFLSSFLPETSEKINNQFNFPKPDIKNLKFNLTKQGKVNKAEILFRKI